MACQMLRVRAGVPITRPLYGKQSLLAEGDLGHAKAHSTTPAWVLWEHFTGVMRGEAEDFWLLRGSDETRAGCLQLAEQEVEIQTGGQPESLRGKMVQVNLRLGWSRQVTTPTSYVERAPKGQRDFMRREWECWPSDSDPREPKEK